MQEIQIRKSFVVVVDYIILPMFQFSRFQGPQFPGAFIVRTIDNGQVKECSDFVDLQEIEQTVKSKGNKNYEGIVIVILCASVIPMFFPFIVIAIIIL